MRSPRLPVVESDGDLIVLRCPSVGLWRDAPPIGRVLRPGDPMGDLEVLGVLHPLVVPEEVGGVVVEVGGDGVLARRPVDRRTRLLVLDREGVVGSVAAPAGTKVAAEAGLVFRSPSAGRFFGRPSPDKPGFVTAGDVIEVGRTVGLLEVMKTFTRIHYGGPEVPARARVKRVIPADEQDLAAGDPILELEPDSSA